MKNVRSHSLIFLILISCQFVSAQENDTLTVDDKKTKVAFYPAIGYSPETKLNIGVIAFFVFSHHADKQAEYYRPSSLSPFIIYTTNNQFLSKIDYDHYFKNGNNLNVEVRYFNFPDFYYGLGNDTDVDIREQYTDNFFRAEGRYLKPLQNKLFVGAMFDFQYNSIKKVPDGGLLQSDNPIGINGGRNMGIGPAFLYDSRNSTLWPTDGRFLNAGFMYFGSAVVGEYNYTRYLFDYRQYMKLFGPNSVLAFQFKATMHSGSDIPFYKMAKLGGGERLRGFTHKNLYRDRQSLYAQVEARQHIWWRIGGVLFAGVGSVFHSFEEDLKSDYVRVIYGLGGRFQALKDERFNIRLDVGFTDNGQSAFYLSVREAF